GRGPGFLVGGVPRELERSFALGRGPWFVIEGDEYDSAYFDKEAKFLHYRPAMLLLNAIEFDHADIYRDLEHVKSAFRKLLGILPAGAPLIACGVGVGWEDGAAALAEFRGVRRRQEVVGTVGGVTVIDDFAHHPTAVAGTLAALRERYPGRRLRAVFEPRSNTSRRRVFQDE